MKLKILQQLLLKIPSGKVTTYKEVAKAMGSKSYRHIGTLLGSNPEPDRYPCYKVVCSDGSVGGYSGGTDEKIKRLKSDGIGISDGRISDFNERLFIFVE